MIRNHFSTEPNDDAGLFMQFPERPLDEIWGSTKTSKVQSTTGRLMPLHGLFKRATEEEE